MVRTAKFEFVADASTIAGQTRYALQDTRFTHMQAQEITFHQTCRQYQNTLCSSRRSTPTNLKISSADCCNRSRPKRVSSTCVCRAELSLASVSLRRVHTKSTTQHVKTMLLLFVFQTLVVTQAICDTSQQLGRTLDRNHTVFTELACYTVNHHVHSMLLVHRAQMGYALQLILVEQ